MAAAYRPNCYHGGMNHPEAITEEFLCCRLCRLEFKLPSKILACGHTFCAHCLEVYNGCCKFSRDICCPTCARPTALHHSLGVEGLRDNIFVEAQIDHLLRRHNNAKMRFNSFYDIAKFHLTKITESAHFEHDRYGFRSKHDPHNAETTLLITPIHESPPPNRMNFNACMQRPAW